MNEIKGFSFRDVVNNGNKLNEEQAKRVVPSKAQPVVTANELLTKLGWTRSKTTKYSNPDEILYVKGSNSLLFRKSSKTCEIVYKDYFTMDLNLSIAVTQFLEELNK